MTSARDVIAETKIAARLKIGMAPVDVLAPVGTHNAETILAALDAAGFKIIYRDELMEFLKAMEAAKETT